MIEQLTIEMVPTENLPLVWPSFQVMLEETPELWMTYNTADSILESLLMGHLQLWSLLDQERRIKMVVLTRVGEHATGRTLHILWGKGTDIRRILPCVQGLEALARKIECTRLEIMGRDGWLRLLKEYGYEKSYIVIAKDLTALAPREVN